MRAKRRVKMSNRSMNDIFYASGVINPSHARGIGHRTSMSIGNGADAHSFSNCVVIGQGAKATADSQIVIGSPLSEGEPTILIGGVDVLAEIRELREIIAEQNEIIHKLWYAPGMPGSAEARELWDKDTK
jgi:hypothetical protein